MNKAFTQKKVLVLDDNYAIKPGAGSSVILEFTEPRLNEKGETVDFKEVWYMTRVAQALRKYADLELASDDIEDLIDRADKVYSVIDSIDKHFKQF